MLEWRYNRQRIFITMEVFRRVLVCVVYWLYVAVKRILTLFVCVSLFVAVCGCVGLSESYS